ncbi:MAG: TatD family hydrolase [Desulfovibrionaceae bacterium]|nr:TatD family hydrolase [Desulfovibrionaceae bacterium]
MGHKKVVRIDPLTQALPLGGVDSHAHLDDPAFDADREAVLERAKKVGLSHVINICLDPLKFKATQDLFSSHPEVFFVVGIHPQDGLKATDESFLALEKTLSTEDKVKAVGEIGLDYHWDDCPREIQYEIFVRQLDLARASQKPVVIHCREAEEDCLVCLESHGFVGYPLLWHCFGGDSQLVRRLLKNGWHISVPGPVTYPANKQIREAVALIPADRLLFETDCPYLAPHPWRGTRNEPAYTVFTVQALALARGEDPAKLWQACGENAKRFFGLD